MYYNLKEKEKLSNQLLNKFDIFPYGWLQGDDQLSIMI